MTSETGTSETSAHTRALVFRLLERFCSQNNLKLTTGDPHGHAGRIENTSGKYWYFVGARFDLNRQGAAEIAKDKAYTLKFLAEEGIPLPASCFIQASSLNSNTSLPERVLGFLEQNTCPLFLKPNTGQEGVDVMRIDTDDQLLSSLGQLAARHDHLLLQEALAGRELRIVVLDGNILCAIERTPPRIIGDGMQNLAQLIDNYFGSDVRDDRIQSELSRQGLTIASVPAKGQAVTLLPVANLSSGGSAAIVSTDRLSSEVVAIACKATEALGLRFAGVDLIIPDGHSKHEAVVLEVNAAPGLSHLHRKGAEEARLVEDIYFRIFETALLQD